MQSVNVAVTATKSNAIVSDVRNFYLSLCRACGFRVTETTLHGEYFASAAAHHPFFGDLRLEIDEKGIAFTCSAPRSALYGLFTFDLTAWKIYPPNQLNEADRPAMEIAIQACPELRSYLTIGTLSHDPSKLLPKDEENRPDSPYMFELIAKLMLLFTRTI